MEIYRCHAPVDVVPRVSAGRLVIGIWTGQSWPQQDYVTTKLYSYAMHHLTSKVSRPWTLNSARAIRVLAAIVAS